MCFFHKSASPDGDVAIGALMEESGWEAVFLAFFCHHFSIQEEKNDRGDDRWFPVSWWEVSAQTCRTQGVLMLAVYSNYILGHNSFCQHGMQYAIEIKDLKTESSVSTSGEKRFFMETKGNWSPSSDMRRNSLKVLLLLLFYFVIQRLGQFRLFFET